jgi:N-acetylglutamate synthase
MKYSIREMTINDYNEAYRLWEQAEGLDLDESDSQEAITVYLKRNQGFCFVACSDEKIIGTVLCGHDGRRGILRHLAVRLDYSGKGIARKLINEVLSALQKDGIKKCNTFVLDENVGGRRFWEHMGWHVLEEDYRTMQTPTFKEI